MTKKKTELLEYQAFDAKDRSKIIRIRRTNGTHHAPANTYLLDVVSDGGKNQEIAIIYSFMVVKITGRNLQHLQLAIEKRECDFIQNYDAEVFATPESDEAVIDSIEIITNR
ncbi:hypothetical protein [Methylovulum psychrotolerans]|uniref:Uncharacterized protein n=1 Tax=Methylovulum psychrotolerans TaxID=1704499 RepID=A0A2S5CFR9_9GAMM|nr:hypothetical protein [Methylovulum psychrotolerans]POZ49654.1 hypothetical protein AADEFJLK_04570 [Methylovulum psychrotolerans]